MNWDNVKDNKCPRCTGYMYMTGHFTRCPFCSFKFRTAKLLNLLGGKESKAYKDKVARNKGIKKYHKKQKIKKERAILLQKTEVVSNLNKMFSRGEVSQFEYETKMKSLQK